MLNNTYAVIDLGSNSFHMKIVEMIAGEPRVVSKVKRKVRLASGLDDNNVLSLEAMERGWECLAWFGEHLSELELSQVKVVATATLRLAVNADEFTARGNELLGVPINIISGEREAALIYHGMAVTSNGCGKRLIIDIGGASTELILGDGVTPIVLNSLNMGCVTWLERYFGDGLLTDSNFNAAIVGAKKVLAPVQADYLAHSWQLTLGASGSVQAVQEVLVAQGLNEEVTLAKLQQLKSQCIECGSQDSLLIEGLKPERRVVFVSGLCILIALFEELAISTMLASGGALREGVINQLSGGEQQDDICLASYQSIAQRFQLNSLQSQQVAQVALKFASDIELADTLLPMLKYSALLHEIGVSVDYAQAPKHACYLLSHLPLAGFSKQQRLLLVALVGNYRGDIDAELLKIQGCCSFDEASKLLLCLRLAVICVGRYQGQRCQQLKLAPTEHGFVLEQTSQLFEQAPLLKTMLNQEIADNPLLIS
ncbi:MAG: guanosine-5'-triphosphate,3'-diphosphate pyrophosphatase [Psychrobium sp.]